MVVFSRLDEFTPRKDELSAPSVRLAEMLRIPVGLRRVGGCLETLVDQAVGGCLDYGTQAILHGACLAWSK